jgi:hypothetical protein
MPPYGGGMHIQSASYGGMGIGGHMQGGGHMKGNGGVGPVKLFVGALPHNYQENELRELFRPYGLIQV